MDWSEWSDQFDDAQRRATKSGRGIYLQFEKQGCRGCRRLYQQVYEQKDVLEELYRWFVPCKVDIYTASDLRRQYQAIWTPTIFFLDRRGGVVESIHGVPDAETLQITIRLSRARLLLTRGQFQQAEQLLSETEQRAPQHPRVATVLYWKLISQYLYLKDIALLEQGMQELRNRFPGSLETRILPF